MARKRDITRTYRPDLCSAETLDDRLDVSRSTLDGYVRLGHLPAPIEIGTQRRWCWSDIEAWIAARNGRDPATFEDIRSNDDDPFIKGIANANAAQG
jgi:predicted DNA-binding transcriptional regulator AlpA